MSEFFEYNFLSMEKYYNYICKEKLSFSQDGKKCFINFNLLYIFLGHFLNKKWLTTTLDSMVRRKSIGN